MAIRIDLSLTRPLVDALPLRLLHLPIQTQKSAIAGGVHRSGSRLFSSDSENSDDRVLSLRLAVEAASRRAEDIIRQLRSIRTYPPKQESTFALRTLRPEKLASGDRIVVEEARRELTVGLANAFPSVILHTRKVRLVLGPPRESFPAGLRGFLYYWTHPTHAIPLAGEIRFRRTSPQGSFASGNDYRVQRGTLWRIPLLTIAGTESYVPLREVLLRDGLVDAATMERARALWEVHKLKRNISRVIHSFRQPFVIDLSTHLFTFYFFGKQGLHQSEFWNLCSVKGPLMRHGVQPFEGRLLCCFEPSQYPRYAGRRVVVMRVLKVLTPVRYDPRYHGPRNMPPPRAGGLLCSYYRWGELGTASSGPGDARWGPWCVDVARQNWEMNVLFEHPGVAASGRPRMGVAPELSASVLELLTKDM